MKPGSLIQKVEGAVFNWKPFTPVFTLVPDGLPVILHEWKFGERHEEASFYLAIEGYHKFTQPDGSISYIWYDWRGFRELQPPMDLSFIEEMQITNPQKELIII